jgi:hypothetical protein
MLPINLVLRMVFADLTFAGKRRVRNAPTGPRKARPDDKLRAVPTKPVREAPMSRYRRRKIGGGAFFFTLALADGGGGDLLTSIGECTREHGAARLCLFCFTVTLARRKQICALAHGHVGRRVFRGAVVTGEIAEHASATCFPHVALPDLCAALRAIGLGLEVCVVDQDIAQDR